MNYARVDKDSRQHDVPEQHDDGSPATAATAREYAESRRRITELLDAKPGTSVLIFRAPTDKEPDEPARIQGSEEQTRFSIAKHMDEKQLSQSEPGSSWWSESNCCYHAGPQARQGSPP